HGGGRQEDSPSQRTSSEQNSGVRRITQHHCGQGADPDDATGRQQDEAVASSALLCDHRAYEHEYAGKHCQPVSASLWRQDEVKWGEGAERQNKRADNRRERSPRPPRGYGYRSEPRYNAPESVDGFVSTKDARRCPT